MDYEQQSVPLTSCEANTIRLDYEVSGQQSLVARNIDIRIFGEKDVNDKTSAEVVLINRYFHASDDPAPFAEMTEIVAAIGWDEQRGCVAGSFALMHDIRGPNLFCKPQIAFALNGKWQNDPMEAPTADDTTKHNFNFVWLAEVK